MMDVIGTIALIVGFLVVVEIWRWRRRPEQRRLRVIKKIGGRR